MRIDITIIQTLPSPIVVWSRWFSGSFNIELFLRNARRRREENIGRTSIKPQGLVQRSQKTYIIYIFSFIFTVDWVLQLILIMPVQRARILARFFFFFLERSPHVHFYTGSVDQDFMAYGVFRLRLICVCKTVWGNLNTPAKAAVKLDMHIRIYGLRANAGTCGYDAGAGITFRFWILNPTQMCRS